jgi:HPr kinase/phosphorylase
MQIHASCVSRDGAGVLLLGPSGCGKSDLVLQLLECGFVLVADDRVDVQDRVARAPTALAGLLEVRGLGILHVAHAEQTCLALAVTLEPPAERLPEPLPHPVFGVPLVYVDPRAASATARIRRALDCALGQTAQHTGAFAP